MEQLGSGVHPEKRQVMHVYVYVCVYVCVHKLSPFAVAQSESISCLPGSHQVQLRQLEDVGEPLDCESVA